MRTRFTAFALLAASIVAASVTAGAGSAHPVPQPRGKRRPGRLRAVERLVPGPAYEPTLAISKEGTLFFPSGVPASGPFGVPAGEPPILGQAEIRSSNNGGATWQDVTPSDVPAVEYQEAIDPYMTIDPLTDRVYRAVYQAPSTGAGGCIDLVWSDDDGASWTHQPKACGTGLVHDHESLATGVPRLPLPSVGYPNRLYMCVNSTEGSSCTVSRDGGLSFGPFVNVYPAIDSGYGWCGGLHSPVVTDSKGRVFLPRTYCGVPTVAVSDDEGVTWTKHEINTKHTPLPSELVDAGGNPVNYIDVQDVSIAVDSGDNLYAAWVASDGFPWVSTSRDHGETWSRAWRVKLPGVTAVGPNFLSIDAGSPGRLAIAFVGTTHPGGFKKNKRAKDWKGARWNLYLAVAKRALGRRPHVRGTRVNRARDPIGTNRCGLTRCAPCAWTCPGMYDYIDVDHDGAGRPWVAFVDVCHRRCRRTGKIDKARGAVATLKRGPSLIRAVRRLPPLQ